VHVLITQYSPLSWGTSLP